MRSFSIFKWVPPFTKFVFIGFLGVQICGGGAAFIGCFGSFPPSSSPQLPSFVLLQLRSILAPPSLGLRSLKTRFFFDDRTKLSDLVYYPNQAESFVKWS